MNVLKTAQSILQVSRPGFWSTHLWFYLLPLGTYRLLDDWTFWLGACYVMFPLGFLLYGWNDMADFQTDRLNPRKGNLLFGAKLPEDELHRLPLRIALVHVPFWIVFTLVLGPKFLLWIAATLLVNACYNWPRFGFKAHPFLDLLNQTGYLLVFVLSSWVNGVPQLPWPAFVFGALFAMHSHLLGQISDVVPDAAAGRRTTAVVIGIVKSKLLLAALLWVEAWLCWTYFESPVLDAFLALAGLVFLLDAVARGARQVSDTQLRAVLIAWNVVTVASMYWIWKTGVFVAHAALP